MILCGFIFFIIHLNDKTWKRDKISKLYVSECESKYAFLEKNIALRQTVVTYNRYNTILWSTLPTYRLRFSLFLPARFPKTMAMHSARLILWGSKR